MENHTNKVQELNERRSAKVLEKVSDVKEENLGRNVKNPVPENVAKPTSIIKILPNKVKKVTLPQNCSVRTFVVNCSNNSQSNTLPSTSTSNATDHEYVHRENSEESLNILYFNEDVQVNEPKRSESKRHRENDISYIPEKISKVHSENCCCVCRDTLEEILQKQEEILSYLKSGSPNVYRDIKFDLLPPMPFNDLNDFLDFDESLSNENVLDQLITKLQRLLVSIDKKSVSNIMASIMTNELCKKISWIGIKDTIAFQNTNMVNHIIDVILDHHGLDVDIIKGFIAEWLRRCSDRIASEVRRNKKKAQQFGYDDT